MSDAYSKELLLALVSGGERGSSLMTGASWDEVVLVMVLTVEMGLVGWTLAFPSSLSTSRWFSLWHSSNRWRRRRFSSIKATLSACSRVTCSSSSSILAFFRSRALCAATRFFSFLLMIFSSRVRWSSRCLFLTGAAAVATGSATSISDLTCQSRGAMIVVVVVAAAAFSEERSRTAVITILLGTPMLKTVLVLMDGNTSNASERHHFE